MVAKKGKTQTKGTGSSKTPAKGDAPVQSRTKKWDDYTRKQLHNFCKARKIEVDPKASGSKQDYVDKLENYDALYGPSSDISRLPEGWQRIWRKEELQEACKARSISLDGLINNEKLREALENYAAANGSAEDTDFVALPSPTVSEGPEFDQPLKASKETLVAARTEEHLGFGRGFWSAGHHCYRNSAIVALLHSNRFISWIKHRHVANLKAAGLRITSDTGRAVDALLGPETEGSEDEDGTDRHSRSAYTDVWCEIYHLSRLYWHEAEGVPEPAQLKLAMERFWKYLTDSQRDIEAGPGIANQTDHFGSNHHQDISEFLLWLFSLSVGQLRSFYERQVLRPADRLASALQLGLCGTSANVTTGYQKLL